MDDERLFDAARAIFDRFAARPVEDGEISRQIGNARRHACGKNFGMQTVVSRCVTTSWPLVDLEAIESITRSGPGLVKLREKSPVSLESQKLKTLQVLQTMFPGDPLVCCAKDLWDAQTRHLSQWENLEEHQFIVPSPMRNERGQTLEGKASSRCLENTGGRHYLVVEFDFKAEDDGHHKSDAGLVAVSRDEAAMSKRRMVSSLIRDGFSVQDICASLILHLATMVPPFIVVHSGGKSLHGWFPCKGIEETILARFMRYAVQLGADRATWTRCQFVRMPGGLRDNGNRQNIVYYDPGGLS